MNRLNLVLTLLANVGRAEPRKTKVLIIDGQNNHKWAETTPYLRAILEEASVFTVDVSTAPPARPKAPALPKNATPAQQAATAAVS